MVEKKKQTSHQIRACRENLKKANAAVAVKKRKEDLLKIDTRLHDLEGEIDDEVSKQIAIRLKTVDRKLLKNEILSVFYDMGGRTWLKKITKKDPKMYLSLMKEILKSENDKDSGSAGRGVTVNVYGGRRGREEIDITPSEQA